MSIFWIFSDALAGTAVYGTYTLGSVSNATFSVNFAASISGSSQEFLFMTGDKTHFMIVTYGMTGDICSLSPRTLPATNPSKSSLCHTSRSTLPSGSLSQMLMCSVTLIYIEVTTNYRMAL
jgi:hypothetical protein